MLKKVSTKNFLFDSVRLLTVIIIVFGFFITPPQITNAEPNLIITPITWNIMGLDSNNVAVGPNIFPVGARVCNVGSSTANNLISNFYWDSSDQYINLRNAGTVNEINSLKYDALAAGECTDFYYEVEITRSSLAYNHTRDYYVTVTADSLGTVSTTKPREIFVEYLISQNRNSTDMVYLDDVQKPSGSTMNLQIGQIYEIKLEASTATQGYNQLEDFINFPNTIFQILDVQTTYTANSSTYVANANDKIYADACLWDSNPDSVTYRSCVGSDGKAGGTIVNTYTVKIIGGAGTTSALNTLIYDFSGSSYHYNSDFGVEARYVSISSPLTMTKSFSPATITSAGTPSTLSISIANSSGVDVTGVTMTDVFPTSPGAMIVAGTPDYSTSSGCLPSPAFSAISGDTSITYTGGVKANSTCTVSVNVSVATDGTYLNTTQPLLINGADTGITASASLTRSISNPGTSCSTKTMASWNMLNATATSWQTDVTTRTATLGIPANGQFVTPGTQSPSSGGNAWESYGYQKNTFNATTSQYYQFAIDTSKYTKVKLSFSVMNNSGGPTDLYVFFGTNSSPATQTSKIQTAGAISTIWSTKDLDFTSDAISTTGVTYFRIYGFNANNAQSGANLYLDDVAFTGESCISYDPPTIDKAFITDPISAGGKTALTFTLHNTNSNPLTLAAFSDVLPTGMKVTSDPSDLIEPYSTSSTTCANATFSPAIGDTTLNFSGGTIPASGTCTATVFVTSDNAKTYTNLSGYVSSSETGINTTTGTATDTLTVNMLPPVISKAFSPNPVKVDSISTLTFTITNPNSATTLTGVGFTDNMPDDLVAGTPTTTCTSGVLTASTSSTIILSGATIPAGGACLVSVPTSSAIAASYPNTSGNVYADTIGNGNTASDTLLVNPTTPKLSLLKQVSTSSNGPWSTKINVAVGDNIYYRFTIENIGDVDLSPVWVTDPEISTSSCAWPSILPVGSQTADPTASCVVGPVKAISGTNDNTANASGTYNGSTTTSTDSTATYVTTALSLEKTSNTLHYSNIGDTISYSYKVTNTGAASLPDPVKVFDTNTIVTCPSATTVGDGDSNLDKDEYLLCTGSYLVTATDMATGSITNSAFATASSATSNTDRAVVYENKPDLVVEKSNDTNGGYATYLEPFHWIVTVSNIGPVTASFSNGDRIFTDSLPSGPNYGNPTAVVTGISGNVTCLVTGQTLDCSANGDVSIAGGQSFNVSIAGTPNSYSTLVNMVAVDPDKLIDESNEGNNNGSDTVMIQQPLPDLKIDKTNDTTDGKIAINSSFNWILTVSNIGGSAAIFDSGIQIIADSLPGGVNYGTPSPSISTISCQVNGTSSKTLDCSTNDIVNIAAEGNFTVTLPATPIQAGTITNTATIDPVHKIVDSNTANNTDSDSVTVESSDLTVSKTNNSDGKGMQGTSFVWTIKVDNIGPVAATFSAGQTLLRDVFDAGVTPPVSASASSLDGVADNVVCTIDDEIIDLVSKKVLNCKADTGGVSIAATTGSFSVVMTVTPTAGGTLTNTAIVDPADVLEESSETNNSAEDSLLIALNAPSISVEKTSSTEVITASGQVIPYQFAVSNTGSVVLSGVTVVDLKCDSGPIYVSGDANIDLQLQLTETWIYTCEHTVTGSEFSSKSPLSNTVTVDSTQSDSSTDTLSIPLAIIHVDKTSTTSAITASGQDVKYDFSVTNVGSEPLSNITVGDLQCDSFPTYVSGDTSNTGILDTDETWLYACHHEVTEGEYTAGVDLSNTVTVDSDESRAVTDTLTIPIAAIRVVKSSDTTLIKSIDQTVTYTFTITNEGSEPLTGITVIDELCSTTPTYSSGDENPLGTLGTSETWIYTCTHAVTGTELLAGSKLSNTVTVDSDQTSSVTDTLSIDVASLTVDKASITSSVTSAGDVITYRITVNNSGTIPLTNILVSDEMCDEGVITGPEGDGNGDSILQTSETWSYSCQRTVTQSEMDAGGNISNTVRVTSSESDPATHTLDIPIIQSPSLAVLKTSTTSLITTPGQVVPYTITITNNGNMALSEISVADPTPECDEAPVYYSGDNNPKNILDLNESWVYKCNHTVTGDEISNSETLTNKATVDAKEIEPVERTLDISISKAPLIGIAKLAETPTKVEGKPGVWLVTYQILIKNYGNIPLTDIQITDNLTNAFVDNPSVEPATSFLVTGVESDDFVVNWPGYTGVDDAHSNLLKDLASLAVGDQGTLNVTLELTPASQGPFPNTAKVTAKGNGQDVEDLSTVGIDPDPDKNGDPTDNSTTTGTNFSANIFDPPHGIKVFDDTGLPALQWTMEWINDTNITAINAEVYDPLSAGTTYIALGLPSGTGYPDGSPDGSTDVGVSCTDSSLITTTVWCYFEGPTESYPRGRIVWKGVLGPDLGKSDPIDALNDLQIQFLVTVAGGVGGVENNATVNADLNGDGDVEDLGEVTAASATKVWGNLSSGQVSTQAGTDKLPGTGFAPFVTTVLKPQPSSLEYSSTGGLVLEIPAVNVKASILGIPKNSTTGEWDVSWLSNQVGWLTGTEFPTGPGNSVLTAHVYLANGKPGPFVNIGNLKWGDNIIIHEGAKNYVYEVRELKSVLPSSQAAFIHEDRAWITLVTCQGFNEKTGQYDRRKLVRAVLVSVSDD